MATILGAQEKIQKPKTEIKKDRKGRKYELKSLM